MNEYYNKNTMNLKQLTRDLEKQDLLVKYQMMLITCQYTIYAI